MLLMYVLLSLVLVLLVCDCLSARVCVRVCVFVLCACACLRVCDVVVCVCVVVCVLLFLLLSWLRVCFACMSDLCRVPHRGLSCSGPRGSSTHDLKNRLRLKQAFTNCVP